MTHPVKQWFDMQLTDQSVKDRNQWLGQADEWEKAGKPITRKEILFLLRDTGLTIEEMRQIKDGTSPILNGFNMIMPDGCKTACKTNQKSGINSVEF